jgi:hypothetical protein
MAENQHRLIKGYRELTQPEIDLMNEIKQKGLELEALLQKASEHVESQHFAAIPEEKMRLHNAEPHRWIEVAKTDFQTGLMALTRSIAQPTFF